MRSRIRRLVPASARLLLCFWALALCAQDAGLVLRTSVEYNTRKATLPLAEGVRREADRLGEEARGATRAGRLGDALRLYYQGFALMGNRPWTPAAEFAASLQGRLDHAVLEPGARATLTLSALYSSERTAMQALECSVVLAPVKKEGTQPRSTGPAEKVDAGSLPFSTRISIPPDASGDYTLEVRLKAPERIPAAVQVSWSKAIPIHVEALADAVEKLRARLSATDSESPAALTAAYALTLLARADSGDISPHGVRIREELAGANDLLDTLDAGRDPFAGKRGDFRKAYRFAGDGTLQPYRLFVPDQYDGRNPIPLVVALHGMGYDENAIFDHYQAGLFQREAARAGFLVACPKGRDPASMYRGAAESDVLAVSAEVRRDYRIDAARIYLMGHSMGAYGTWSIAAAHPDLFAALGPIAGGGNPAGMAKIAHIPQYVVHGDADKTVAVSQSRAMVEAGRKAGARIVYVEVPGGGHNDVVAPAIAPMFDFFAGQSRR